jgi:hypothetical protein
VEQPASLIGALNSPHDKSADERQSLETKPISRGTESSNPVPSSKESANFRSLSGGRIGVRGPSSSAGAPLTCCWRRSRRAEPSSTVLESHQFQIAVVCCDRRNCPCHVRRTKQCE